MAELFCEEWMNQLKDAWNVDPEVKDALAAIGFSSVIAFGFTREDEPRGVLVVDNGECVDAGDYNGEDLDWDMRAGRKQWMKWVAEGLGVAGLGMAYATGRLKILQGDFKTAFKDPRLAGPMSKGLGLMSKIGAE